jgi:hypothetical protein
MHISIVFDGEAGAKSRMVLGGSPADLRMSKLNILKSKLA